VPEHRDEPICQSVMCSSGCAEAFAVLTLAFVSQSVYSMSVCLCWCTDSCKKSAVVFDEAIASFDVINCQSVQAQVGRSASLSAPSRFFSSTRRVSYINF